MTDPRPLSEVFWRDQDPDNRIRALEARIAKLEAVAEAAQVVVKFQDDLFFGEVPIEGWSEPGRSLAFAVRALREGK